MVMATAMLNQLAMIMAAECPYPRQSLVLQRD
jgi:hypothetical protein